MAAQLERLGHRLEQFGRRSNQPALVSLGQSYRIQADVLRKSGAPEFFSSEVVEKDVAQFTDETRASLEASGYLIVPPLRGKTTRDIVGKDYNGYWYGKNPDIDLHSRKSEVAVRLSGERLKPAVTVNFDDVLGDQIEDALKNETKACQNIPGVGIAIGTLPDYAEFLVNYRDLAGAEFFDGLSFNQSPHIITRTPTGGPRNPFNEYYTVAETIQEHRVEIHHTGLDYRNYPTSNDNPHELWTVVVPLVFPKSGYSDPVKKTR